jgi:hypothetical protein
MDSSILMSGVLIMSSLDARPFTMWWVDERNRGSVSYMTLDAVMEEFHTGKATVTKYPVQRGFEVSDHVIRHNKLLKVRGVVVNTDLGGIDVEGASTGGFLGNLVGLGGLGSTVGGILADPIGTAGNYVDSAISAAGTVLNPAIGVLNAGLEATGFEALTDGTPIQELLTGEKVASRLDNAFKNIERIQEAGILCQVSTILKVYDPVVLVEYNIPQTIENSTN